MTKVKDIYNYINTIAPYDEMEQWDNSGTGLEAEDVTTLGLISNYHFTDHISFEILPGQNSGWPKIQLHRLPASFY